MATLNELAWLDATAQAELVRRHQVKPIELVEVAVERIAAPGRFESEQAAARGRYPERAAAIVAVGHWHHTGRHGCG